MTRSIGIDFGTCNSAMAHMHRGEPRVILNQQNMDVTPSAVSLGKRGELLVGKEARNRAVLEPENTILSIKRKIGTDERIAFNGRTYTPTEIAALILRKMKKDAEVRLGEPVGRAVITVPAYYGERAAAATREAGRLAGFTVLRMINEPMAASLAYGLDRAPEAAKTILVYDLGAGTFDISIVMLVQGAFAVIGHLGDTHLGGDDFDQLIIDYLIELVRTEHGVDLSEDRRALQKLRSAAEEAKIALSSQSYAEVVLPAIAPGVDLEAELSRAQYEEWIRPHIERTVELVRKAVQDADMALDMVDHMLLVGGPTYTPLVQSALESLVGRERLLRQVNPMLCVAMGAAIQTGLVTEIDCPNPRCNQKNPVEAEVCSACGRSLVGDEKVDCPACFMPNDIDRRSCWKCGASLAPGVRPQPAATATWTCQECGKPNPANLTACSVCQAPRDRGGLRCPSPGCGYINEPGARKCARCGADFGPSVLDVTAKDLGVELHDGRMSVIIPKGTGFPTATPATRPYYTVAENQRQLEVAIYEGENPQANRNDYCGAVTMELPPGLPKGTAVAISFDLDPSRTIYVTVQLQDGSGRQVQARIRRTTMPADMKKELEQMQRQAEKLLEEAQEALDDMDRKDLEGLRSEIAEVLDSGDSARAEQALPGWKEHLAASQRKADTLDEIRHVLARASWVVEVVREYMEKDKADTIARMVAEVEAALGKHRVEEAAEKARALTQYMDGLGGVINLITYCQYASAHPSVPPALQSRLAGGLAELKRAFHSNNRQLMERTLTELGRMLDEAARYLNVRPEDMASGITDTKH